MESFLLTSEEIMRENVDELQLQNESSFSTWMTTKITLLVYLQATAGNRSVVIWYDYNDREILRNETDFEKQDSYWHWPSMEITDLDTGNYSVEYYLNRVRWFKAYFEVGR